MIEFLRRYLGGRRRGADALAAPLAEQHARLRFDAEPDAIYAIGDVHGRLDLLLELEQRIQADAAATAGEKWLITLGDHVDRGPRSAEVLTHIGRPAPTGFRRFSLLGNHEREMLDFLARPMQGGRWLHLGGVETLLSYGVPIDTVLGPTKPAKWRAALAAAIPAAHRDLLRTLPLLIETPNYLFVHAGPTPGLALDRQAELDLISYRDDFADDFTPFGKTIVHGHQIIDAPLVTSARIGLDTGAFITGVLSAVKLVPGRPPEILQAGDGVRS